MLDRALSLDCLGTSLELLNKSTLFNLVCYLGRCPWIGFDALLAPPPPSSTSVVAISKHSIPTYLSHLMPFSLHLSSPIQRVQYLHDGKNIYGQ